jgi:uncharacterized protein YneF (UPF0154 family)
MLWIIVAFYAGTFVGIFIVSLGRAAKELAPLPVQQTADQEAPCI